MTFQFPALPPYFFKFRDQYHEILKSIFVSGIEPLWKKSHLHYLNSFFNCFRWIWIQGKEYLRLGQNATEYIVASLQIFTCIEYLQKTKLSFVQTIIMIYIY